MIKLNALNEQTERLCGFTPLRPLFPGESVAALMALSKLQILVSKHLVSA